jgi:hypothetical protein
MLRSAPWRTRPGNFVRFVLAAAALLLGLADRAPATLVVVPSSKTYLVVVSVPEVPAHAGRLAYVDQEARQIFDTFTDVRTGKVLPSDASLLSGGRATRAAILDAIAGYSRRLRRGDTLVVYWTGFSHRETLQGDALFYTSDRSSSNTVAVMADLVTLADATPDSKFVLIADGCNIGNAIVSAVRSQHPNLSTLAASKNDEVALDGPQGSPFFLGFMAALKSGASDLDGDGEISLEEAFISAYSAVVRKALGYQHPTLTGLTAHKVKLVRIPQAEIDFDDALPSDLLESNVITVNGRPLQIDLGSSTPKRLVFLGEPAGIVGRGMTYIEGLKSHVLYWREDQALKKFEQPYARSAAVLVAIDDYERKRDPLRRGPTGFEGRSGMVEGARKLRDALVRNGFDRRDIIELYDQDATSANIERALRRFWQGSDLQDVDRLFIYFGGHGTTVAGTGVLVTYDYDRARPTQSGVLMRDLSGREAENLVPRQVMVALDACASGLAVYKSLGDAPRVPVREVQNLSVIRNDTSGKARNFLVAGTGDQAALWDDGGVFTKALVGGLDGSADSNGDGIVQFLELANYVSNEVTRAASRRNVVQQVQHYDLSALGTGRMLFFAPEKVQAR